MRWAAVTIPMAKPWTLQFSHGERCITVEISRRRAHRPRSGMRAMKYSRHALQCPASRPTLYVPAADRYEKVGYRRCGRSGLQLPPISLGLWQNFGDDRPWPTSRAMLRRAFDLGITHFDLANNYGPPYG